MQTIPTEWSCWAPNCSDQRRAWRVLAASISPSPGGAIGGLCCPGKFTLNKNVAMTQSVSLGSVCRRESPRTQRRKGDDQPDHKLNLIWRWRVKRQWGLSDSQPPLIVLCHDSCAFIGNKKFPMKLWNLAHTVDIQVQLSMHLAPNPVSPSPKTSSWLLWKGRGYIPKLHRARRISNFS